jgi:hypothetical protein
VSSSGHSILRHPFFLVGIPLIALVASALYYDNFYRHRIRPLEASELGGLAGKAKLSPKRFELDLYNGTELELVEATVELHFQLYSKAEIEAEERKANEAREKCRKNNGGFDPLFCPGDMFLPSLLGDGDIVVDGGSRSRRYSFVAKVPPHAVAKFKTDLAWNLGPYKSWEWKIIGARGRRGGSQSLK